MLQRKFFGPHKNWVPPPPTGRGYFTTSATGTQFTVYDFTNKSVALSSGHKVTAGDGVYSQGSAGNTEFGLWMKGSGTNVTIRYRYATNIVDAGNNLTDSVSGSNGFGFGNDVKGIFSKGGIPATRLTMKYEYAASTVVAGGVLTIGPSGRCAADGNIEKAILMLGASGSDPVPRITNVYTYASDTAAAGSLMVRGSSGGANSSISNADVVIFTLSFLTQKYPLATGTVVDSTNLPSGGCNTYKGASDGTQGLIVTGSISGVGNTKTTNLWKFADSTVVLGTEFTANIEGASTNGASSLNPGVNVAA